MGQRKKRSLKKKDKTKIYIALVFFIVLTSIGIMGSGPSNIAPYLAANGAADMTPQFIMQSASVSGDNLMFSIIYPGNGREGDLGVMIIVEMDDGTFATLDKEFIIPYDSEKTFSIKGSDTIPPVDFSHAVSVTAQDPNSYAADHIQLA